MPAGVWLEPDFLERLAKAGALWLLLVSLGAYENPLYLADALDPASLVLMRSLLPLPIT